MGEARAKHSATQKLIAAYPDCALCGGHRPATTRDHIPPKALFNGSHRPNEIVVPACDVCNQGSRTSDLVVSIVSRWRYSDEETEFADHSRLVDRLRKQAPAVVQEWVGDTRFSRSKARRHLRSQGVYVPDESGLAFIGPQTIPHLNLFAHKLTLGLYFAKVGRALDAQGVVSAYWRTKEDMQKSAFPKELLEALPKLDFLKQGAWSEQRTFEFRFDVNRTEQVFACVARCRMLFVVGFGVGGRSRAGLNDDKEDWLEPSEVLGMLKSDRFKKRAA